MKISKLAPLLPCLLFCNLAFVSTSIDEDIFADVGKVSKKLKKITKEEYAPMVMDFITALQKLNLQLRKEIAEDIETIARNQGNSGETIEELNPKFVGTQSSQFLPESVMTAQSVYKLLKLSNNDKDKIIAHFQPLKDDTKGAVLMLAINNEDLNTFNAIIDNKLVTPTVNHYNVALDRMSMTRSENMEIILESLSKFDLDVKALGTTLTAFKSNKEFDVLQAQHFIQQTNFPILKKMLDNGLNPNLRIKGFGSFLSLSVYNQCFKCVEALIEKGADVNVGFELDAEVHFEGLQKKENPFTWTPMMIAVGQGNTRIVKALVTTNKAQVTKASLDNKDLNARTLTRMIPNFKLRKDILSELKICPVDQSRIDLVLANDSVSLNDVMKSNDIKKVEAVLLSGKEKLSQAHMEYALLNCNSNIVELLIDELVPIINDTSITTILNQTNLTDSTEKIALIGKYNIRRNNVVA